MKTPLKWGMAPFRLEKSIDGLIKSPGDPCCDNVLFESVVLRVMVDWSKLAPFGWQIPSWWVKSRTAKIIHPDGRGTDVSFKVTHHFVEQKPLKRFLHPYDSRTISF
jgi:hypothetical protein